MNHQLPIENLYLPEGQLLAQPRNKEFTSSLSHLERAMHQGMILEAMALLCDGDMNLHIDFPALPGVVAIIPPKEAVYTRDGAPVKDIAILTRVGKSVCFKVVDIRQQDGVPHLTLSRRAAQAECVANYLTTLCPGDIIPARVTHMESFGAFVDIGCGISSLLSVDTISVSRLSHPRDRLYNGQTIKAVIKSVETGADGLPGRIFISTRELLGTWEENAARFTPGQTVAGIIRSVEDYGVFVELAPNLAGLAELKEDGRDEGERKAVVKTLIGRRATVFIKSILPERMKIKLVLIDTYAEEPASPPPLTYFLPKDGSTHLDRWVYSPQGAKKQIESVFEEK
ncbi:MAG: 30S ribosomal protein S1 [Ruminococcaceae bacterium]|nr:30S ribosomal protein S1 [Oscillospiraceae bacterium]